MRAVRIEARGGPEAIVAGEMPTPAPAAGEILLRVHAAAITPSELEWIPTFTAASGEPRTFPVIPGHEFAGVVEALGPGVSDPAVGDRVFGMSDWFRDGAQAELAVARAIDVAPAPRSIDLVTASVVPISALTAWQGLVDRARLASGERVLVHGAAGSVGCFAVQLAKQRGATVIATVSAHNLAFARELGADVVVDHRTQRFEDFAAAVDVVFDTVGGETLERSWGLLRPGGRAVTIAAAGERTNDPRTRDAFFIVVPSRAQLAEVAARIDAGSLRVFVDRVFGLDAAQAGYRHRPVRGKATLALPA